MATSTTSTTIEQLAVSPMPTAETTTEPSSSNSASATNGDVNNNEPTPVLTNDSVATGLRLPALDAIHGLGTEAKVKRTRVLVVGAGGVGCELLKNLASVGFGHVSVIDLDTIDFSNLNRQFLFRRVHVGKAKATEAASSIRGMIPDASIEGLLDNIKNARFNVDFFKSFAVVCNALDNLDARRHVNRMCLAAEVPLVESGSTGYNGQCEVFGKGYECYDCIDHPPPKSYAVCTIRSTPEKPVHCVTWAKLLFELVFGPPDADNVLSDLDGNAAVTAEEGEKAGEKKAENGVANEPTVKKVEKEKDLQLENEGATANAGTEPAARKRIRFLESDTPESFVSRLCERVFVDDTEEQRRMESLWSSRAPPEVQNVTKLSDSSSNEGLEYEKVDALDQVCWSVERSAWVLVHALRHMVIERRGEVGEVKFDKDDRDALLFVTAASNLRASAYGVSLQSPFQVKGIAGNIVHAVATTNAMVAGLIALEAVRLVANDGDVGKCKKTIVSKGVMGSRVHTLLQTDPMRKPNDSCFVCRSGHVRLSVDVDDMTLGNLVNAVCRGRMAIRDPIVQSSVEGRHYTVYECGVGLDEDEIADYQKMEGKKLRDVHLPDGAVVTVEDLRQNIKCNMHVRHVSGLKEELKADERFTLDGDVPTGENEKVKEMEKKEKKRMEEIDDVDDLTWVEEVDKEKPDWGRLEAEEKAKKEKEEQESKDVMEVESKDADTDEENGKAASRKRSIAEAKTANGVDEGRRRTGENGVDVVDVDGEPAAKRAKNGAD